MSARAKITTGKVEAFNPTHLSALQEKRDFVFLAAGLILFLMLSLIMSPFYPDDSYITFRYAENLAAGHGLRFNLNGPPVEGYSNFLWVVILAGFALVGIDMTVGGVTAGIILGLMSLWALWWLMRRIGHTGWSLAIPLALFVVSGPFILYTISGMETALFAFLLLALMVFVELNFKSPGILVGIAMALVGLLLAQTRPEGIVALPLVAIAAFFITRQANPAYKKGLGRSIFWALGLYTLLLALYHFGRVSYFGELVPTPFISKSTGLGSLVDPWVVNVRQYFVRQTHYYTPMGYYYLVIAIPALVSAWVSMRKPLQHSIELIAAVMAIAYGLIYINVVDWMPGMRYHVALVGLLLIPFGRLGEIFNEGSDPATLRYPNLAFGLIGLLAVIVSFSGLAALRLNSQQLHTSTQVSLVQLGQWLHDVMPADTRLAMSDVGATPYFSRLHTIDINPNSLTDRYIAENGWSDEYFFDVSPDVVILTAFSLTEPDFYRVHEELYAHPRFQAAYNLIGVTRNDWYQDRSYWVFLRQGIQLSPEQMADFPQGIRKQ